MKRLLFIFLAVALLAGVASMQTPVQQVSTRLDAATQVCTVVYSTGTCTLTPNAGELVYIYEIDIENCAGGTAVTAATPTSITVGSGQLQGNPAWTMGSGVAAGACDQMQSFAYPSGMRSATPGTAVVFTMPTFATNQTIRLNIAWRSGYGQ